jgi:DNA/RNA endonuclease YhcR with UshA esterase domain
MKSKGLAGFALVVGLMMSGSLVLAHHGTAASYDPNKEVTMKGTVTEFVWANPHGQLHWDVKDDKGTVVNWGGELHSIGLMTRAGWNKNIIKAGDVVAVTGHPSRYGTPYMVVTSIVLNGKEFFRDIPQS